MWSWGGLGGSCRTDLLRGPIRRRHRVRLYLRLDLTRCPYVLLVLGVIGIHCQLGLLVNDLLRFMRRTKSQIRVCGQRYYY